MNKHTDKVVVLGYECGVLLSKEDEEFSAYSCNNPDLPYGFYDEDQGFVLRKNLATAKEKAMKYVENGVDRTYAVVSLQGMFDREVAKELCNEFVSDVMDYSYFKNAEDIVYSVCKVDGIIREGFLEAALEAVNEEKEIQTSGLTFAEQANTMLEDLLSRPSGENIFALSIILYKQKEVTQDLSLEEKLSLAQKTLDACQESAVPLLIAERADAVAVLLEYGMKSMRSPEFPEATPEQMKKLLLSCDIEVFTDIVDAVAVDNQEWNAPDNAYFGIDKVREKSIAAIENVVSEKEKGPPAEELPRVIPPAYKEIAEDAVNEMENALRDGFAPTFVDNCIELPFSDGFLPGYALVVWGEENDNEEKFFSVSVCKYKDGEAGESVVALFTDTASFDDLENGIFVALSRVDTQMQKQLFIPDDDLMINDDRESVNAYLWALDSLVDRLPSAEEMDNINFYADYNLKTGDVKLTATYDTVLADGELNKELNVDLSSSEKRLLIDALNKYCAERCAEASCLDLVNKCRDEDGLEPIPASAAKSSLADVIRSASAKAVSESDDKRSLKKRLLQNVKF